MTMTKEDARDYIRDHWREILSGTTEFARDRANGELSYVCPLCGHGEHGDGLTYNPHSEDGNILHCFGCGFNGDIIDLIEKEKGVGYMEALNYAAEELNITIAGSENADTSKPEIKDHTEYYEKARRNIEAPAAAAYLKSRGITVGTAMRYGIGYDPESDIAESGHPAPRIIIPITSSFYIGRSIDPNTPDKLKKLNNKGSEAGIFNADCLQDSRINAVFVVEGAFDALSIAEMGKTAIALNSTGNAKVLIKKLEQNPPAHHPTMIICLDNEQDAKKRENVRKAEQTLREGFDRLNLEHITADISGAYKDANEHLVKDKENFRLAVEKALRQTEPRADNVVDYIRYQFQSEVNSFSLYKACKTGYQNLDEEMGGLYPGLYGIGAIPSLGKTTFCHQMADQLAESGKEVLYFSLEQSRLELVSKSISRIAAQTTGAYPFSSLEIRLGNKHADIDKAMEEYVDKVGNRLSIVEGNFGFDYDSIERYIRTYIRRTGVTPIVFIDYLQIVQPSDSMAKKNQTTKDSIDSVLTALKQLSRNLNMIIIVISSFNRTNYQSIADFTSFKETGGIEYTCDVVLAMQLRCLRDKEFPRDANKARETFNDEKSKTPRHVELVCLKTRFGRPGFQCYYEYDAAHDLFKLGNEEYSLKPDDGPALPW